MKYSMANEHMDQIDSDFSRHLGSVKDIKMNTLNIGQHN